MLRVDLGCGRKKTAGFIGVDRFALPEVDVVADINRKLPFADGSVDLLLASHSLEHAADLMATMKDLYRICRHGAQICILAPYNEQKLNLANPYHVSVFNEHTPRFWTNARNVAVDAAEFEHPYVSGWGLAASDNSDPGFDLRLVRMEFFYFPAFVHLPVEEQRALRRERLDVCDQVMYNLIVWKGDDRSPGRDFAAHANSFVAFEPEAITQRKIMERDALIKQRESERDGGRRELAAASKMLEKRAAEIATMKAGERELIEAAADVGRERDDALRQFDMMRSQLAQSEAALAAALETARHRSGDADERAAQALRERDDALRQFDMMRAQLAQSEAALAAALETTRHRSGDADERAAQALRERDDALRQFDMMRAQLAQSEAALAAALETTRQRSGDAGERVAQLLRERDEGIRRAESLLEQLGKKEQALAEAGIEMRRKFKEDEAVIRTCLRERDEAVRGAQGLVAELAQRDSALLEARDALRRLAGEKDDERLRIGQRLDTVLAQLQQMREVIEHKDALIARLSEEARRRDGIAAELERANLRMGEARTECERLLESLERAALDRQALRKALEEGAAKLAESAGEVTRTQDLESDLSRSARDLHDARRGEQDLRTQLSLGQTRIDMLGDELVAARTALARTHAEHAVLKDHVSTAMAELAVLRSRLADQEARAQEAQAALGVAQSECGHLAQALGAVRQESADLRALLAGANEAAKARLALVRAELEAASGMLAWFQSKEATWTAEMAGKDVELSAARRAESLWPEARNTVDNLYAQISGQRISWRSRLAALLGRRDAMWDAIGPPFASIKAYTATHFRSGRRGLRFVLGGDLRYLPFHEYRVPFRCEQLTLVTLAVRPLLPAAHGLVGVEVVAPDAGVVAQATLPLASVSAVEPSHFMLPAPVNGLASGWCLRVFVRDADVPVALYELVRGSLIGGETLHVPFASLG